MSGLSIPRRPVRARRARTYDAEIGPLLPQLLWLQQMGLVLFWVHDRSEASANSCRLAERVAPVVARAIALTRFRVLRPLVRETHDLLSDFMPTAAGMAASGPTSAARATRAAESAARKRPKKESPNDVQRAGQ